jgi:hypothetical protein
VPQSIVTNDVPVGLQLTVQPRVSPDGLITMNVQVINSSVGDPDAGIPIGFGPGGEVIRSPIINETAANTVVNAYSGQTVVFAGLISKNRSSNRSQVPILGSIPILGAAFRFDVETEQRRELLVVLTPRLVQTDEDYQDLMQVESSRMSWCLADVLNVYGDVGLSGGNGLWGPARGATMYPDRMPNRPSDRAEHNLDNLYPMRGDYQAPVEYGQPMQSVPQYNQPDYTEPNYTEPVQPAPTYNQEASKLRLPVMQPASYSGNVPVQTAQGSNAGTVAKPAGVQKGAYR